MPTFLLSMRLQQRSAFMGLMAKHYPNAYIGPTMPGPISHISVHISVSSQVHAPGGWSQRGRRCGEGGCKTPGGN